MNVSQTANKAMNSRIVLTQMFAVLIFVTLLLSTSRWDVRHLLFEESLFLTGVVLVAVCVVGRTWSLSYISGSKRKRLITAGPYSLCRNPLYLSSFLGALGLGLCTETITIPLIVLISFALYYPGVIHREELRLHKLFGQEFMAYCRSVPAFFPTWKVFAEGDTMHISVRPFRRGLRDLGVFVLAIGLIEFLEALHQSNILPTFLTLY